jgi:uncharacterized protein
MKYLLVLLVVAIGVWALLRPRRTPPPAAPRKPRSEPPSAPADMVACAHCDLRLPRSEALLDAQGRSYCDDAHRRAGPR